MRRVLALIFLVLSTFASVSTAADKTNIVFILVDDLRWDALGCMGHPFSQTPHIDRVAHEGALYKNFFVTTPLCSPSRGSFLTGQYVHTHGVHNNLDHSALSHNLVTWPALLQKSGYETAYVGKWHMGADASPRPGFDRWVSFKGQGQFINPPLNIDGQPVNAQGYMTDILNNYAVEFVKKSHSKPFALYLSHKAVHGPFTPAERHRELFADAKPELPPSVTDAEKSRAGKPALGSVIDQPRRAKKSQRNKKGPDDTAEAPAGRPATMLNQLRCLASIDDGVGALLQALESTGQLDNTVVVFTSDNGYFWGEHGLGDKRWAYEESIRAPLCIRYPTLIKPGTKLDQLSLNIDLAPTLIELAGASIPTAMQGRSLVPVLRGDVSDWRTSILAEYFRDGNRTHPAWQAVRTERWKYIHYPQQPQWNELYDVEADRHEMNNLIADASTHEELKSLQVELERLLAESK